MPIELILKIFVTALATACSRESTRMSGVCRAGVKSVKQDCDRNLYIYVRRSIVTKTIVSCIKGAVETSFAVADDVQFVAKPISR